MLANDAVCMGLRRCQGGRWVDQENYRGGEFNYDMKEEWQVNGYRHLHCGAFFGEKPQTRLREKLPERWECHT